MTGMVLWTRVLTQNMVCLLSADDKSDKLLGPHFISKYADDKSDKLLGPHFISKYLSFVKITL